MQRPTNAGHVAGKEQHPTQQTDNSKSNPNQHSKTHRTRAVQTQVPKARGTNENPQAPRLTPNRPLTHAAPPNLPLTKARGTTKRPTTLPARSVCPQHSARWQTIPRRKTKVGVSASFGDGRGLDACLRKTQGTHSIAD